MKPIRQHMIAAMLMLAGMSTTAVGADAENIRFSEVAKRNCYQVDSIRREVYLIFPIAHDFFDEPTDSILSIFAYGSVSEYRDQPERFQLNRWSADSCFFSVFPYDQIDRPGNSGQPEFTLVVQRPDSQFYYYLPDTIGPKAMDRRLLFVNNDQTIVLLLPGASDYFTCNPDTIAARQHEAQYVRPLADYNLTDSVDQHRISNFRLVPGTKQLYRSYHPYFPNHPYFDTEPARLYWSAELARRAGIRSDITLSSNHEADAGSYYQCGDSLCEIVIPDYHRAIIDRGDILYVGASMGGSPNSSECFFHSDGPIFSTWMQEVILFLADEQHPLPAQMHCALGADRTGMFAAVIALLCGAEWGEVVADYEATGRMHKQSYRHANRLRYAIRLLTGLDPDRTPADQLTQTVRNRIIHNCGLSADIVDRMVVRLTADIPAALPSHAVEPTAATKTLLNGQLVILRNGSLYDALGRKTNLSHGSADRMRLRRIKN